MVNAEKGLLQVYLTGKGTTEFTLTGGTALNVVSDTATYNGEHADAIAQNSMNWVMISRKTSKKLLSREKRYIQKM